jgi:hypothetical protein
MTLKLTRQRLLIAGALVIAAGVTRVAQREETPAVVRAPSSNPVSPATQPGAGGIPVDDVKLELLKGSRADLGEPERNPFRFRPKPPPPAPPAPPRAVGPPQPIPSAPPVPAGPPPPPPIPLRFIGLVEAPTQAGRVAILSDGRGNVFYGKEGDIIEGRYRLVRVGPDAAEIAYTDGRGRQTVRLSGQ